MSKIAVAGTKQELDRILDKEFISKWDKGVSVVINEESVFISKEPVNKEVTQDPLFDIESISVKTGIKDFARHHDFYIYGTPKGESE